MKGRIIELVVVATISCFIGILCGHIASHHMTEPKKVTYEVNFTDEEKELIFQVLDEITSERMVDQ